VERVFGTQCKESEEVRSFVEGMGRIFALGFIVGNIGGGGGVQWVDKKGRDAL